MQAARKITEEEDAALTAPPPHIAPYVRAIGEEKAAELLLAFGGTKIYLAADPKSRSRLAQLVGREEAIALAKALGPGHVLIPIAKPWLARHLFFRQGWTVYDIARKLHATDGTVRRYIGQRRDDRQLSLL